MNKKMLLALFSSVLLTTGCGNNEPAAGGNLANGSNSQVDQHSQSKEIVAANLFGDVAQKFDSLLPDSPLKENISFGKESTGRNRFGRNKPMKDSMIHVGSDSKKESSQSGLNKFYEAARAAFSLGAEFFEHKKEEKKIDVKKEKNGVEKNKSAAVKFMALYGNSVLSKTQKDFFMSIGISFGALSKGECQLKDPNNPGRMIGCFEGAIEKLKVVRTEKAAAEKEHLNTIFQGDTLMKALEAAAALCKARGDTKAGSK